MCLPLVCTAVEMPFLKRGLPDAKSMRKKLLTFLIPFGGETKSPFVANSAAEKVTDGLLHDLSADVGDRGRERDFLGTDLDAVLRVTTFLDASVPH
ncbi:MAG: hypothetical protein JWO91_1606 [Acidobacteriaceae bacterium]|jgi:hypothetical protein|nr:hypothetical protein [Acidobacteriaceae bacterium]